MLDKLPVDLLQHWILSNLTAEDCANLSLVNKGLHQAVKSMLPWKPALRWHQQLLTGEWERLWKNVFVTQTPIHDNQLIYYLQHFPMNITRFQQTFVKAARCNCVQALQLVWSLWQGQQEPNDHLLTLTVQVAVRHACVAGSLDSVRWMLKELKHVVDLHAVKDNWDFCCHTGNVELLQLWMDKHDLGAQDLQERNWYPIMVAACNGRVAAVKYLFEKCAISAADVALILHHVLRGLVRSNQLLMLDVLLTKAGITTLDAFDRVPGGVSQLLMLCVELESAVALSYCVDKFAIDINEFERDNCKLLQLLIGRAKIDLLEALFQVEGSKSEELWHKSLNPTIPERCRSDTDNVVAVTPLRLLDIVCTHDQNPIVHSYVVAQLQSETIAAVDFEHLESLDQSLED
eukprot:TRINITY_DN10255_c0_g2_i4.p1 TRINITY_DN10255_c0_g2~~TRINITY_DN10255_c0_g2_i4.p1  ORF type:complete len:403 (+),score=72.18 TRINITY_DN10255_c0_g2_i4:142-1350(+)